MFSTKWHFNILSLAALLCSNSAEISRFEVPLRGRRQARGIFHPVRLGTGLSLIESLFQSESNPVIPDPRNVLAIVSTVDNAEMRRLSSCFERLSFAGVLFDSFESNHCKYSTRLAP